MIRPPSVYIGVFDNTAFFIDRIRKQWICGRVKIQILIAGLDSLQISMKASESMVKIKKKSEKIQTNGQFSDF